MIKGSKIKIFFYENRSASFLRYPLWIAEKLKHKGHFQFIFTCNETIEEEHKIKLCEALIDVQFHETKLPLVSTLKKLIKDCSPDLIIVFAHRIPDIALITAAKILGVKTAYYQHGLYVPFMKRNLSLFFSNAYKTLKYLLLSFLLGRHLKIGYLGGFYAFFKLLIKGENIHRTSLPVSETTADLCLVYGEYWRKYHSSEYGYKLDNSVKIVGTPDLVDINLLEDKDPLKKSNEICYVAQTLVEDGRLKRENMQVFLRNLSEICRQKSIHLVIKLHPRSDRSLYVNLDCQKRLVEEFPDSPLYIGHYSSMLIRGLNCTNKFLLYNFYGHSIPDYLKDMSSSIIEEDQLDVLSNALDILISLEPNKEEFNKKRTQLNHFFHANSTDPFTRTSDEILKFLSKT